MADRGTWFFQTYTRWEVESEDCRALWRQGLGIFTFIDFELMRVTWSTGQPRRLLQFAESVTGVPGLGKYTLIWQVSQEMGDRFCRLR